MSAKRQATSELNHENWNDEEPTDDKDMGTFRTASKDVLEKRVIKTAKRRNPISSERPSVFSGFGGFNKPQSSSFDMLANLTNDIKKTNGSTGASSAGTTTSPSLFTSKPTSTSGGLFSAQSTSSVSNPSQPSMWTSPFGTSVQTSSSSLFTTTTSDSTTKESPFKIPTVSKETPFKIQPVSGTSNMDTTIPTNNSANTDPGKTANKTSTSMFGVVSSSANDSKTLFSSSTPFKMASSTTAMVQTSSGVTTPVVTSVIPEKKSDEKRNEKKIMYYSKLKGLNEAVSDWVSKHVAQTPLCNLSPIFKDYERYLKEITEEYQSGIKEEPVKKMDIEAPATNTDKTESTKTSASFGITNNGSSALTSQNSKTASPFGINKTASSSFATTTNQETKISSPFAINSAGSSPSKTQDTKTTPFGNSSSGFTSPLKPDTKTSPFAMNNTISSPLTNQDTKTATSFVMINGSSTVPKSNDAKVLTPFAGTNTSSSLTSSPSNQNTKISSPFAVNTGSSPNSDTKINTPFPMTSVANSSLFGGQNAQSSPESKQPTFSFGIKTSSNTDTSTPSSGFSFGATPTASSQTTSPFSLTSNAPSNQTAAAPFSFNMGGKPFSFSAHNVQTPSGEAAATENEDEEPPKVEYTPVKEDNSVYEKKCKIFVKKDGNFADKGVGTLYIKKIEGNNKHQLLVRANTKLGTVLLNLILAEAIPTQRMGKNNVMLVCVPTPDTNPSPTPVLIRVKTAEEADELLETLNKYKA